MKIQQISVTKLFGLFDHTIPLNREHRITIIYGPNGYGKTYLLKLVDALFHLDYAMFGQIPFEKLLIEFDDGGLIEAVKQENNRNEHIRITYSKSGKKPITADVEQLIRKITKKLPVHFINTERLMHFSDTEKDCPVITEYSHAITEILNDPDGVSDDIDERINLFVRTVNNRFLHKQFEINGQSGFVFTTSAGIVLKPELLSSGEQHAVVLFYELLFKILPDSLVLIDEPELSLHIYWQQQFIEDLQNIIELNGFDAVIATHSPQIIHDRWDLTVELKDPEE